MDGTKLLEVPGTLSQVVKGQSHNDTGVGVTVATTPVTTEGYELLLGYFYRFTG
jgi:hypothetical protein